MTTPTTDFTEAELAAAAAVAIERRPSLRPRLGEAHALLLEGYRIKVDGVYFRDASVTLPNGICRRCGPAQGACIHELAVRILAFAEDLRGEQ